jgi:serine/threonine protein kinase
MDFSFNNDLFVAEPQSLLSEDSGGLGFEQSISVNEDKFRCVHERLGTFVRNPPLLNALDSRAELGSGSFGTLIRAKLLPLSSPNESNTSSDKLYALKCVSTVQMGDGVENIPIEEIAEEAETLQKLNHSAIVQYVASCYDAPNKTFYIVMEFVDGMTLSRKVHCNPIPSEFEVFTWMKQIASALDYLHNEMSIVHRDLKPSNVLVSVVGNVIKLCDFGLACDASLVSGGTTRRVGTRNYFSYEKIVGLSYDNGCDDMWALGCILVELLAQQRLECPLQQPDPLYTSDESWPWWSVERVSTYREQLLQTAAVVSPLLGGEILPGLLILCLGADVQDREPTGAAVRHRTTAAELLQALTEAEPRVGERHAELQSGTARITAVHLQRGRDLVRKNVNGLLELVSPVSVQGQESNGTEEAE